MVFSSLVANVLTFLVPNNINLMTSGTGAARKKRQYISNTYFDNAVTALLIRLPTGPKKIMED